MNAYAEILKEQGCTVLNEGGIWWYKYQGFIMPAYLPHCVPPIQTDAVKEIFKSSKIPFVRWDSHFGTTEISEWWYVLKKGTWNISDIKHKKKRWMINKGKNKYAIRTMSYDEVIDLCPKVALKAIQRYKGRSAIEDNEVLTKRIRAGLKVPGVLEYIGCFDGNTLVSFSENYIQDNAVWLAIIRHDPEHLKNYSSYALMNGILDYYLNKKGFSYVLDGCRSIHHKTNFQDHLISNFAFSKEYANLNVEYSPAFGSIVKIAYPFRILFESMAEKINNSIIDNISAVLKQEWIRKECINSSSQVE